jgi:hypothetical protein
VRTGVLKLLLVFLLVAATVAGCAHLPPIPPDQRTTRQGEDAAADIDRRPYQHDTRKTRE